MGIGAQGGHAKKEDIDGLQKTSHFEQKELKAMYKQFRKEAPSGVITKAELRGVMAQLGVQDAFLQDLLFRIFDTNKDGSISFTEFVHTLSVITRGTPDQKLELAFRMYDQDEDGMITKAEMTRIIDAFCKSVGPLVTYSGKKYESGEALVEEFFEEMDANDDGKVSLDEYRDGAMRNHDIIQGLKLFEQSATTNAGAPASALSSSSVAPAAK